MMTDSPVHYDRASDSMYVVLQDGRAADTEIHDDREFAIDLDAAGNPIGYDIQHASRHPDVIAEALALLQRRDAA